MQIDDLKLIAMVVAVVAGIREQFPKIDGTAFVFGLTILVSTALCFLMGGDTPRNLIQHGFVIAMTAAGGMHALNYHASKGAPTALAGEFVELKSVPPPPNLPSDK